MKKLVTFELTIEGDDIIDLQDLKDAFHECIITNGHTKLIKEIIRPASGE